jgi:CxC5 like cysteine cluster associated with KDZ transposases/CxC6 like cysteine cluster associated with KDZ transposases
MLLWMALLPSVYASQRDFPNISFHSFSLLISSNFHPDISLATVLFLLFSLTENTDLLNLHSRQQQNLYHSERATKYTAWMSALVNAVCDQLDEEMKTHLFLSSEPIENELLGNKLDSMAQKLKLLPYTKSGQFKSKRIQPISHDQIKPILLLCPSTFTCTTATCNPRSLLQFTRERDIPHTKLIIGTVIHDNVPVLTGKCPLCDTRYAADRERFLDPSDNTTWKRLYTNNARYLKVGQNLWVDRSFSKGVMNGMFSFHASSKAYTQFWNNSYGSTSAPITLRHVWQAFVQESIRTIAAKSSHSLELLDNLPIAEVTGKAFEILGHNGSIHAAAEHSCSECSHPYKHTAIHDQTAVHMDVDAADVKMVVLDGIVMGPTVSFENHISFEFILYYIQHCAFDGCTAALANARGGSFCSHHELVFGNKCRVRDCSNPQVVNTEACLDHQNMWQKHKQTHSRDHLMGVRRLIQRPQELLPWQTPQHHPHHPHDEESPDFVRKHFFSPARSYCVETIVAPCGVVVAWTKFYKSESPTNILNFLDTIYPTPNSRPSYICIDKACQVLRTCIANGSWDEWKNTTRFIVDSYHYTNHKAADYLCSKFCNPSPSDGSAPNLVQFTTDSHGVMQMQRVFNTQVSIVF